MFTIFPYRYVPYQVLQLPWQVNSLATSAAAAKHGMESTKTMGSLAGRSNYVEQQRMMNIPDPGNISRTM